VILCFILIKGFEFMIKVSFRTPGTPGKEIKDKTSWG
jgi:hypothetical protein